MLKEFKDFLIKDNALALAVGVIIGGAFGKFVGSITDDLLMPIIGVFMPQDASWATWGFDLIREGNTVKVGSFFAALINLLIVGFVCFTIVKFIIGKKKEG